MKFHSKEKISIPIEAEVCDLERGLRPKGVIQNGKREWNVEHTCHIKLKYYSNNRLNFYTTSWKTNFFSQNRSEA